MRNHRFAAYDADAYEGLGIKAPGDLAALPDKPLFMTLPCSCGELNKYPAMLPDAPGA